MYNYLKKSGLALLVTSACGFHASNNAPPDGTVIVPPDATKTQYGTYVTIQFLTPSDVPTTSLMFTDNVDIDTGTSAMCDVHNKQSIIYCVVAGTNITLAEGKTIRAHGTKPLVLLATSTFDLQGTIDVSSKRSTSNGAGASATCAGNAAAAGHSGGYGASFAGKGGTGEKLSGGSETGGAPAPAMTFPAALQGGCPGGNGATDSGPGGAGGSAGGAVAIIADAINLNGTINASGAAGSGGPAMMSGGGGGGSGGMIVLDAALVSPGDKGTMIWLFANGGGGGQGGTGGSGTGSGAGDDGMESVDPTTPITGGNNSNRSGGSGGDGAAGTSKKDGDNGGEAAAMGNGGGGGGGGSSGFIRTMAISGITIAPTPTSP